MKLAREWAILLLVAGAGVRWLPAVAEEPETTEPEPSEFIRFEKDGRGGGQLKSAIVTYRRDDGVTVHLVGALHVGEKSYYDRLQETFEGYDALLYEMIKDRDAPVSRAARRSDSMLSVFQRALTDVLKLEFQLDGIDYSRDHFIHADMDAATFFTLQKERGESILTLMLRAIQHDLARQSRGEATNQITLVDIIRVLLSKDRAREMKLVLARQFKDIEATLAGFEGEKGSVILTERNKVALGVLKETIARGKKNIGIFYGAGHMQDIERRLIRDLGFRRERSEWRVAWDMTSPSGTDTSPETEATSATAGRGRRARF